jgi:arylsulfatase A-like enzyme
MKLAQRIRGEIGMTDKPNILFIYPDQMRYDAMSNAGNSCIKTPAIDRLADEGISFENAYTSFPLCCPFRASIMTGKYAHNHGLYANHYPIPLGQEFLPEIMNRNGYATGWIGKWHLAGGKKQAFVEKKLRCGFETFIGFTRGHCYDKSVFYRNDGRTPRKSKDYEPIYQTRHLFEFIDHAEKQDKPFFAGICFGMPHFPLLAPDEYLKMYDPEDVPLSENVPKEIEQEAREFLAKYYGLVSMVDVEVGNILQGLEERNILENTVIIFVSDHGEMGGEHGVYNKLIIQDASMHVPFIIRYPGQFDTAKIKSIVDPSVDIFPTILDLCDIDIPEYADGISLLEQCEQKENALSRDYVYFENIRQPFEEPGYFSKAARGIRTNDYCYLEEEGEVVELYDLRKDKTEQNNLVNSEEYKEVVNRMHKLLQDEMEKYNDSWDLQYPHGLDDFQTDSDAVGWGMKLYNDAVYDD